MKLYLVRHGQTNWNLEGRIQGQTNIPLNDKGRKQAQQAKEKLQNIPIDLIICSPLMRARETAEIIEKKEIFLLFMKID